MWNKFLIKSYYQKKRRENLEHVSTGKEKIAVEIVAGIYLSAEPDRLIGLAEMFDYKKEQTR